MLKTSGLTIRVLFYWIAVFTYITIMLSPLAGCTVTVPDNSKSETDIITDHPFNTIKLQPADPYFLQITVDQLNQLIQCDYIQQNTELLNLFTACCADTESLWDMEPLHW